MLKGSGLISTKNQAGTSKLSWDLFEPPRSQPSLDRAFSHAVRGLTALRRADRVLPILGTLVLDQAPRKHLGASIRPPNVGTWATGEHVVQPTVPSRECVGCDYFCAEEGTF